MTVKEPAELSQLGGRHGLPNDTILQFLEDHSGGILDTSARSGRMESAFDCYANDGYTIYFAVDQASREAWNMEFDPCVRVRIVNGDCRTYRVEEIHFFGMAREVT
ncbi:hypothetical protein ACFLU3_00475 [Chloroflexota bacterium]